MPTFPQHRNIKSSKSSTSDQNTGAGDQTNNLPAISDLVRVMFMYVFMYLNLLYFLFQLGSIVKKRRME